MNAPDKIYIDDLAVVNDCVTKISLKQIPHFSEYIRKDALMEWVKEKEGFALTRIGKLTYKTMIDKIESL